MMPSADRPHVKRSTVKCQDPKDGTGDLIIDIPDEMFQAIGVVVGDELSIEVVDGVILLSPLSSANPGPGV
ncbi:AbrB/MazE/SpoVT family DNA-binding domain-containing protein [Pseudomonas asiatica]|uniref:AbrB/MazE/SpoVT family DNA-binding domain-containing protein n=1 Tax=Pseudomonas asiatica TaxID=2219225 RepID=UPI0023676B20|nr:AbrB/MazE/SpoVT family DNA-binding domain-containing protein [Pseudomonas asiatica]WDM89259.1 AbrB/MazE/SpoVT family DNA-binding domain-containing protein [Pseudomonas asiatica]